MLNIILAGVGGQGILTIAYVLDSAAVAAGLHFKQAEVHGMAQRGGAVQSHLRISDQPIHSDLIPAGRVDLILSVEPLEALRYAHLLSPTGAVVTSSKPFVNIPDYPELDAVLDRVRALPKVVLVDAGALAGQAGSRRSENVVMIGAAASFYPFEPALCEQFIAQRFAHKTQRVVDANLAAFQLGMAAAAEQL